VSGLHDSSGSLGKTRRKTFCGNVFPPSRRADFIKLDPPVLAKVKL
jgi:hypothetical protein